MGKKAALHNLGCKVNAYETEQMRRLLVEAGYEIVPFAPGADVYVVNTCTVTNIADRKSRQMLHRAKKMNPQAIVVAVGCYVETAEKPVADDPCVDLVLGNSQKSQLIEALSRLEKKRGEREMSVRKESASFSVPPEGRTRAVMKVQDGCNQFCSYCMIPYARGRVRSRKMEEVLEEAAGMAQSGCQEIVLTGIHLSSYGTDLDSSLLGLIQALHEIPGIKRIRLGSLEPTIITESFVKEICSLPKVCPHFHLSLQSGCDSVLKRMNRHYSTAEFEEKCALLRENLDQPAITTDVIVGFPGETEEEFLRTVEFLKKIRLYETHVFKYSARHGTPAAAMPNQVPQKIRNARSDTLLALGEENRSRFEEEHIGKKAQVLLEEVRREKGSEYYVGYTREYIRAAVPVQAGRENLLAEGTLSRTLVPHLMFLEKEKM